MNSTLSTSKRLALGVTAFVSVLAPVMQAGVQGDDREIRTRDRRTYEVIVGDYYTGRSPYFKSLGERGPVLKPVMVAKAEPAPLTNKPASGPCITTTSGLVQLAKTAPAEASLGEPYTYDLTATATGCAGNVVVTDLIPEGTTLVGTQPQASVSGKALTWNIGDLDAGETKNLKVTVKPEKEGTLVSCATIKADPRACAQTVVGRPQLALDTTGPELAQFGSEIAYNIVVKNVGNAVAKGVVVTDKVPAGLGGVKEIPFTVGDLAPGASRTIPVTLTAAERGKHCNIATATASNTASVAADACTLVVKPGLKLVTTGPAQAFLNKHASYQIIASNIGDTELTSVVVTDDAPAQTKIVSAAGGSITGNNVTWNAGSLKAGESKSFEVVLTSAQAGKWCDAASVSSAQGLKESAEACTLWRGLSGVLLEVVDDPDPIQVGESTTYTIRITDQGTADLLNLNTVVHFPKEITPVSSQGGTVEGKTVKFPTVPRLASKQSVTYTIIGKGAEVGDSRLKVVLTEDQLLSPVVEEESTRVY